MRLIRSTWRKDAKRIGINIFVFFVDKKKFVTTEVIEYKLINIPNIQSMDLTVKYSSLLSKIFIENSGKR